MALDFLLGSMSRPSCLYTAVTVIKVRDTFNSDLNCPTVTYRLQQQPTTDMLVWLEPSDWFIAINLFCKLNMFFYLHIVHWQFGTFLRFIHFSKLSPVTHCLSMADSWTLSYKHLICRLIWISFIGYLALVWCLIGQVQMPSSDSLRRVQVTLYITVLHYSYKFTLSVNS